VDRETELDVVLRLRAGDPEAFEAVYDEYRARLFTFLARLARDRDVAEDLLEETWLRLVSHAERLRPDTRLGPWLFAIARNLFCSHCRSRLLDDGHSAGAIGLWPAGTPRPSPFEQAVASDLERRFERALAALPAADREVLLLVVVEGFTVAEAAAVCEVRQDALRQRLSRARARLARELGALDTRVKSS